MVKGFSIGVMTAAGLLIGIAETASLFAQEFDLVREFDRCKMMTDDKARLRCLQDLARHDGKKAPLRTSQDPWRLVRTPDPRGGHEAVSITRPADTLRSDPDFVGLMIRCGETTDIEVLVALLRPLSLRAHPNIVIAYGGDQTVLPASVAPPGALILLPGDAASLANGPWRNTKELEIAVEDPTTIIRGVVPLDGLGSALVNLLASCPLNASPPQ
jgi:hypothetical protein